MHACRLLMHVYSYGTVYGIDAYPVCLLFVPCTTSMSLFCLRLFAVRLNSFYLLEAAQSPTETKSALTDLNWYGDLADVYRANTALAAADATAAAAAAVAAAKPLPFPMRK